VLALLAAVGGAVPVTLTLSDGGSLLYETVELDGSDHLTLEDFVDAVRRIDANATVQWDNAQRLRMRVMGTRVSLFTDRALILIESRLHPTEGPLVTSGGDILVPASVLRDLLDLVPGTGGVTITLPSAPEPVAADPVLIPTAPLASSPMLPPEEQISEDPSPLESLEAPLPRATDGPILLVAIGSSDDRDLIDPTATLLEERLRAGTQSPIRRLRVEEGQWQSALTALETETPKLVIGLQVGRSAQVAVSGVGVFHMAPTVAPSGGAPGWADRYLPHAAVSDLLARQIESEILRTELPWLGRLVAPHWLLRRCPAPSLLIELGQASNQSDLERLSTTAQQALLAGAVAQAVIDWSVRVTPTEHIAWQ
jgi:hypothetical protein